MAVTYTKLACLALLIVAALPTTSISKDSSPVDLPFKDINGQKVRLRTYRGKPVVLNFWATWCVPCREEMPLIAEAEREYSVRGIVFIAASLDDRQSRAKIPDFIARFHLTFPVWVGATTMDLDDLKLGASIPATAFLDREGRIVARVLGQMSSDQLKERLDWLSGDGRGNPPQLTLVNLGAK